MASCPHIASSNLAPPKPTDSVYREDCTLCFDSIDDPAGLDVYTASTAAVLGSESILVYITSNILSP